MNITKKAVSWLVRLVICLPLAVAADLGYLAGCAADWIDDRLPQ